MKKDLLDIFSLTESLERTAALAQWVQELYPSEKNRPVLVGGAAVELLTGGAYVTGDLDFAGSVPPTVARSLKQAGFTRKGRHWLHEKGRVFLEFPSAVLRDGEKAVKRNFSGRTVLVVSPEDLIVDRLSAWLHWRSPLDGVNAYLVYRSVHSGLDQERLKERAAAEKVQQALTSVEEFFSEYGTAVPDGEAMEAWARKGP